MSIESRGGSIVRIRCEKLVDGPGPSEVVVAIKRNEGGHEEVVVDKRVIRGETMEVAKIGATTSSTLIELPRESTSGNWRIWISNEVLA